MYNFSALKPLGDKWPKQKQGAKMLSQQQIADLRTTAEKLNSNGKLDKAIKGLGTIDTSMPDAIQQFALDNEWQFNAGLGQGYVELGYLPQASKPSWMRNGALASEQIYGVSGIIHGYPVVMFVDRVVTSYSGSGGRASSKPHFSRSGVIVVELNKLFPQLVLDSNKNDKFFMKVRSATIDTRQKINLEANFPKYFDFYAPQGINTNSLTVLAPNFMQTLIDSSATFDVEIFGNRLFILTQDPLYSERVMNEALQALKVQLTYMNRLEASWNYQPVSPPFDVLKQTTVSNFYALKIGPFRVGLVQFILTLFVLLVLVGTAFDFFLNI